jgi:hypothetical protein
MSDRDDCHGRDSGDGQASAAGPATDGPVTCPAPTANATAHARHDVSWQGTSIYGKKGCATATEAIDRNM